ncbi:hypothetical protein R3P38DRAFT_3190177 [Favolaschia claudopus]|uniref:Uncharacterized protein n=1 Tax=Favolaschia claudopus TaxID=2862362 RepID=A0AAW0BPZ2_9AGAR
MSPPLELCLLQIHLSNLSHHIRLTRRFRLILVPLVRTHSDSSNFKLHPIRASYLPTSFFWSFGTVVRLPSDTRAATFNGIQSALTLRAVDRYLSRLHPHPSTTPTSSTHPLFLTRISRESLIPTLLRQRLSHANPRRSSSDSCLKQATPNLRPFAPSLSTVACGRRSVPCTSAYTLRPPTYLLLLPQGLGSDLSPTRTLTKPFFFALRSLSTAISRSPPSQHHPLTSPPPERVSSHELNLLPVAAPQTHNTHPVSALPLASSYTRVIDRRFQSIATPSSPNPARASQAQHVYLLRRLLRRAAVTRVLKLKSARWKTGGGIMNE